MSAIRIGIIGDFKAANPTHVATNNGIAHAAESLGVELQVEWLPTEQRHEFGWYQGLFCSPGSPYRSLDGALLGIQYAREHDVPFVGTCGGFQHLVIEYARNVMGIRDAAHAETDPYASCLFVTPLSCSLVGRSMEVSVKPGTRAAAVYGAAGSTESYYCNFGLNPAFQEALEAAGLVVSGHDQDGEARIIELPSNKLFVGTLFVPQARSAKGKPHPLILEFCRAASGSINESQMETASLLA